MKKSLLCKTYAKINLSLDVTGVRGDGYHEVAMVMQGIDLYDEMTVCVSPAEAGGSHSIVLKTDKYFVPVDARNTAYKAAQLIIDEYAPEPAEIRIDIKKNIPVAAGLAGGSSNAAGVIIALNKLLKLGMDIERMCSAGQRIGADVPFCIMTMAAAGAGHGVQGGASCALAEGIGEILTPLPPAELWVVLAKPPVSVSTKVVYKALDELSTYQHPDTEQVVCGVKSGDLDIISSGMANVLENVTLKSFPAVAVLKDQLKDCAGGAPVMMSGSGPTVYALFGEETAAAAAAAALRKVVNDKRTEIFCVRTI